MAVHRTVDSGEDDVGNRQHVCHHHGVEETVTTFEANVVVTHLNLDNGAQLQLLEELDYLALPAEIDGQVEVEIEIDAPSAADAWTRIRADLRHAGASPLRVALDLVSTSDIAARLEVSREIVRLWAAGKRREGYPAPFDRVSQSPVWRWSDIAEWVSAQEDLNSKLDCVPFPSLFVDRINGLLSHRQMPGWKRPSANVISIEAHQRKRSAAQLVDASKWTLTGVKIG